MEGSRLPEVVSISVSMPCQARKRLRACATIHACFPKAFQFLYHRQGRNTRKGHRKVRSLLRRRPDLLAQLPTLKGKRLACWCKPKTCHREVLARLADRKARKMPQLSGKTTAGLARCWPTPISHSEVSARGGRAKTAAEKRKRRYSARAR